jgi:HD superfamily phosphohydrolase YqeK
VNLGQFVITSAVSAAVLTLILGPDFLAAPLWRVAAAGGISAVVYGVLNVLLVSLIVRGVFGDRTLRPWSNMSAIILPMMGMGLLGGLLGAAYLHVGAHMLPLILAVFFLAQMTFASYAQLREAQESTLRGFVKALEAKDLYTRGHTERVAYFATMIGRELGFNGTRLERLRWAALIHDVGKLAVPRDLIRKRARLTDEEYQEMQTHTHLVEDLLAEVEFLQPMVAIAANHHAHFDGNGYGPDDYFFDNNPPLEAAILSVADSFDAMTSTRSYRVALTQEYAFTELRRCAGSQFDPTVVEAFITALTRRDERYGSPNVDDEAEARRRAEDRAGVDG